MSAHTAGPWVTNDGHGPIDGGMAVSSVHDDFLICSCTAYYGREAGKANARLIAAAPELLRALQDALEVMDDWKVGRSVRESCRAAIAKAIGQEAAK